MSTYDEREKQRYQGEPVECFRFVQGENTWLFTSADEEIALPIGLFVPETISRPDESEYSQEDSSDSIEVHVAATNPVAELYIGDVPTSPVWLTLYSAHRGDEASPVTTFTGKMTRSRFDESEAVLVGTNVMADLNKNVPVLQMQTPCNHILYSSECGADPSACSDSITVTTVDGRTVTSNDFALRPDGWYSGGRLLSGDGEMRFIADHEGDTVTLISPMPGLESLDQVWAYWGCDHLEETCAEKFDRLNNHLGWSRLPGRNPFVGRIDTQFTKP